MHLKDLLAYALGPKMFKHVIYDNFSRRRRQNYKQSFYMILKLNWYQVKLDTIALELTHYSMVAKKQVAVG